MEQFLKYFYSIYVEHVFKTQENYYFYYNECLYQIIESNRTKDELYDINEIISILKKDDYPISEFVFNNFNEIISNYDDKNYILLKINCNLSNDVDLIAIINLQARISINNKYNKLYRNNWGNLWEKKIDYFEYQIKELGHNKPIILNSFSYFVGMAENAISLVNYASIKSHLNSSLVISHKRINYPNMELDYYNPLNLIIDLNVRDISGYLKSMFFYSDRKTVLDRLNMYLKSTRITEYEANMLFGRLLYPSYYFDIYESVIEDKKDEEELLMIINKVNEYELFLKDVFVILSKYYNIERVEWIINKKEL
ncbi:MAG: hypothetical protein E7158_04770 [Firmicutes bacterium]|nr:hypothetical protein [Bacillota bacterium]